MRTTHAQGAVALSARITPTLRYFSRLLFFFGRMMNSSRSAVHMPPWRDRSNTIVIPLHFLSASKYTTLSVNRSLILALITLINYWAPTHCHCYVFTTSLFTPSRSCLLVISKSSTWPRRSPFAIIVFVSRSTFYFCQSLLRSRWCVSSAEFVEWVK